MAGSGTEQNALGSGYFMRPGLLGCGDAEAGTAAFALLSLAAGRAGGTGERVGNSFG